MRRLTRRRLLGTFAVVTASAPATVPAAAARQTGDTAGPTGGPRSSANARSINRSLGAADPLALAWERTYGDASYDRLEAAAATGDGAVLAGQSDDPPGSRWAAWLHRVGPDGDTRWHRTFDEDWLETAFAVAAVPDGFLVAGRRRSSPTAAFDAWVRKTDREGRVQWRWTGDAEGDDAATAVVDGVRVAGTTRASDGTDAWLREFGPDGAVRSHRTYGDERDQTVTGAAATADGGALLAGTTSVPDAQFRDAWLARVDADGNSTWSRSYGGERAERASAVHETDEGAVFVGLTGSGDAVLWDLWVVGVDTEGRRRWDRTHGGDGADYAMDLLSVEEGYLVVGASDSGDRDTFDAVTLGVDDTGAYRWHRFDGGPGRDVARAVVPAGGNDSDGGDSTDTGDAGSERDGALVAGQYGSHAPGRIDAWLLGLSAPAGTPAPTPTATDTRSSAPGTDSTPTDSPTPTFEPVDMADVRDEETTTGEGPGFGVASALAVLGVGGWLARNTRER